MTDPSTAPQGPDQLAMALAAHGLNFPPETVAQLAAYAQGLWRWNERMNLTRHTDWDRFAARDVTDAAMLCQLLSPSEVVLDVGTGGGLPGALMKIIQPGLQMHLLEQVEKKANAVRQIVDEMKLDVAVHRDRVQEHLAAHEYETLVVRAVAPMPKLLGWLKNHWPRFRRLLVVKGPAWRDECAQAKEEGLTRRLDIHRALEYPLAGTESMSVILEVAPHGRLRHERSAEEV